MNSVRGILTRVLESLRQVRRRLRPPSDSDLDDLDLGESQPGDQEEAVRRVERVRRLQSLPERSGPGTGSERGRGA